MSSARFLSGATALLVVTGSLTWGARRLRARLLPQSSGALSLLVDIVLLLAGVLGVSQVLGAVGLFRPAPFVAGCILVGAAVGVASGKPPRAGGVSTPRGAGERSRLEWIAGTGALAVAVGTWVVGIANTFPTGIRAFDSIQYHLPKAARFARDGWLTHLHFTGPEFPDAFHPTNNEVVHAIGMMLFGGDFLSPFINLAWLGGLLLAGWCFGATTRREPSTLAATALVAAIPGFARDQAGTAGNDVAALFFVVACAALLVNFAGHRAATAIAAVSGGMALGTKLTVVAAVAALTVGVLVVTRTERRLLAWTWGLPLITAGGFWYARNLVTTGGPLPGLRLGIGPLRFPYGGFALVDVLGYRVTHYSFDIGVWRSWFVPAVSRYFGSLWFVIAAAALGAALLALFIGRSPQSRMLGAVALVAGAAYAATPTSALGLDGQPFLFEANLVYVMPAVALAMLLVPPTLASARAAGRSTLAVGLSALALTAQLSERSPWRGGAVGIGVLSGLVVLAAAALWTLLPRTRRVMISTGIGLIACLAGAGWFGARSYAEHRYRDDDLARWAASVRGARIAEAGLVDQFRLYDPDLTNHVQFVGERGPNGAIHTARSCKGWRGALRRGNFQYVVLRPGDYSTRSPSDDVELQLGLSSVGERELRWTRSDPAASEQLRVGRMIVFAFDASVPDPGCTASPRPEDD